MDPNPARNRARVRKIIELYSERFLGESVSHQNISTYVRRHGWSREKLVEEYRTETKRKVKEKMTAQAPQGKGMKRPDDGKSLGVHEAEVVAMNSDLASEVEIKHKVIGHRMIVAVMEVLEEIQRNSAVDVVSRDGYVSTVAMTPAARAKALKDLLYAIDKAVAIERKSWNMDAAARKGEGNAPFNVLINVPDPLPMPDHLR